MMPIGYLTVLDTRTAGYPARIRVVSEVLKAVDLYGNVAPPDGPENPELVMRQQAEAWARRQWDKRPPSDDLFSDLLTEDQEIAKLTRRRMQDLDLWAEE